jgi:flagellar biosynthesis/type III secretory pathway protein FliH
MTEATAIHDDQATIDDERRTELEATAHEAFGAGFDDGWDGGYQCGLIEGAYRAGKIARYDEAQADERIAVLEEESGLGGA